MSCPRRRSVEWLCPLTEYLGPSASATGSDSRGSSSATGGRGHRAASPDGRRAVRRAPGTGIARRRWGYGNSVGRTSAGDVGALAPAPPRGRRHFVPATRRPRAKRCRRAVSRDVLVFYWRDRVLARLLGGGRLHQGLQALAQLDAAGISRTFACWTTDDYVRRVIRPPPPNFIVSFSSLPAAGPEFHFSVAARLPVGSDRSRLLPVAQCAWQG